MSDIEITNINETVASALDQPETPEDPEPPEVIAEAPVKKPRAKRAPKPAPVEGQEPAPKVKPKRAARKPAAETVIIEQSLIENPEEAPQTPPPRPPALEPPPLERRKSVAKPRAKRAPPQVEFAPEPQVLGLSQANIAELLANHIMETRQNKASLKQERLHNMVAGKIA